MYVNVFVAINLSLNLNLNLKYHNSRHRCSCGLCGGLWYLLSSNMANGTGNIPTHHNYHVKANTYVLSSDNTKIRHTSVYMSNWGGSVGSVIYLESWWRHQMETFSALLALCAGNSPVSVNSPHKGQWRGALMFTLICAGINDWVNNREAGDLRRHLDHYDVSVMVPKLVFVRFICHNGASMVSPLQWHLNGCDGVSNHQPHHCLLNRLFRRRSK